MIINMAGGGGGATLDPYPIIVNGIHQIGYQIVNKGYDSSSTEIGNATVTESNGVFTFKGNQTGYSAVVFGVDLTRYNYIDVYGTFTHTGSSNANKHILAVFNGIDGAFLSSNIVKSVLYPAGTNQSVVFDIRDIKGAMFFGIINVGTYTQKINNLTLRR